MNVRIEGDVKDLADSLSIGEALKASLSGKRGKALAAACSGDISYDLATPLSAITTPGTPEITPVFIDSPAGLELLRHSAAHVMAEAVRRLYPDVKVTIGPAIENGFYYDFDVESPFTPEDFPAIEAEMRKIIAEEQPFRRKVVSKADAVALFTAKGEPYKVELVSAIPDNETVTLYTIGEFVDLCRGPHLPHTGFVKAVKLLSVAGAYWRGDEKNRMLSRIYATAFAEQKELDAYLNLLEEAKKRDHRKIGKEQNLFAFHEDVAPGMVFWHPKGMLVRTILEDFLRKEHLRRQYDIVQGPQLLRRELWEKSGHYANYRENMYFSEIEGDAYGIKPMNCLSHMLIFNSETRSYRDLPQRYFELGVVHRHEKSGVMHGLLRVRQFTQDDAHIICRFDQLEDEIVGVIKLVQDLFGLFGFNIRFGVATRPEKFIGTEEAWDKATNALKMALEHQGIDYAINEGDGAFYGPKIDGRVTDSIGREWQCSTIQVDFTLPERFDLGYVGQDGEKHRPVMVHRAILGSLERFIGVLIEHCAGNFPTWLAPAQARILTVTEAQDGFAAEALAALKKAGIRAELDLRNEKLGFKVREAQMEKIPYILVVGDKEVEAGGVNVRLRGGESLGLETLDAATRRIIDDAEEPFKNGGMSYRFS